MIGYLTSRRGTIPRLDRLLADGGWSGVRGAIDRPVAREPMAGEAKL